ncbi:MAG: adenylate/guanylate cyclase domain-containing protein [Planctomycetota bacterium]
MPDLIAQGPESQNRWRRSPPVGALTITLGREEADLRVPWDPAISRTHAQVKSLGDGKLLVEKLPSATNPIYHNGSKVDECVLVPGEHFVIGETTFIWTTGMHQAGAIEVTPEPIASTLDETLVPLEQMGTSERWDVEPTEINFIDRQSSDSDDRIAVLASLPEMIDGATSDNECMVRITSMVFRCLPWATAIVVIEDAQILHQQNRSPSGVPPTLSKRLIQRTVEVGEGVLHVWQHDDDERSSEYTMGEQIDWAFCLPMFDGRDFSTQSRVVYVCGQSSSSLQPDDLVRDLKWVHLTIQVVTSLRHRQNLIRRQAAVRSFFPAGLLDQFDEANWEKSLEPRTAKIAVLFCDLRGFSAASEHRSDDLLTWLDEVSEMMGIMTAAILDHGGVIGDYHGDSAMGFWGWPIEQDNASERAFATGVSILKQFDALETVERFRCSIGIASGLGVAGRIGTSDQVKVTAFGPVVNRASRIESINREFGSSMLLDDEAASELSSDHQECLRELGQVKLRGIASPTGLFEWRGNATDHEADAYGRLMQDWIAGKPVDSKIREADDSAVRLLKIAIAKGLEPPLVHEQV